MLTPIEPCAHSHRAMCSRPIEPCAHAPLSHVLTPHRIVGTRSVRGGGSLANPNTAFTLPYITMTFYRLMCSRMAPGSEAFARACQFGQRMPYSTRHFRDALLKAPPGYARTPLSHVLTLGRAMCSPRIEPCAHLNEPCALPVEPCAHPIEPCAHTHPRGTL